MTSNQPNPSNPAFKTPQPNQLRSEQDREAVRQRILEEQGAETADVVDESTTKQDDAPTDAVDVIENMDDLSNRHIPTIDSPPG